eukprot:scaffold136393_cov19-Tisochrysis_lutea.AAC.1
MRWAPGSTKGTVTYCVSRTVMKRKCVLPLSGEVRLGVHVSAECWVPPCMHAGWLTTRAFSEGPHAYVHASCYALPDCILGYLHVELCVMKLHVVSGEVIDAAISTSASFGQLCLSLRLRPTWSMKRGRTTL